MKYKVMVRLSLTVFLLAALTTGSAEAGKLKNLHAATEVPRLAALSATADTLPRRRQDVYVREGATRTVRLSIEEVGRGDPSELIVMLHGALSSRETWRYVAGDLGRDHRLLLVDLLGSGESEKVDPAVLGSGGYAPTRQARRVLQALRTFIELRPSPTRRLTIVGHSLGGAVALRLTGAPELRREFADVIERIDRVAMLAPLDFAIENPDPSLVEIVELGRGKVALAAMLGVLRRKAAQATTAAYVDPELATRDEARRLIATLRKRRSRRPAQAQIAQAVPFDLDARRPDWVQIEALVADYRNVTVPCLILWGARDETLPLSMGYKLRAQLPDAGLTVLHDTKHSMQIERPKLVSSIVRNFLRAGLPDQERIVEVWPSDTRD